MFKSKYIWQIFASFVGIVLILAGCFQDVGDSNLPTAISQGITPTDTPLPQPTLTPTDTLTPSDSPEPSPTEFPLITETPTARVQLVAENTATSTPAAVAQADEESTDVFQLTATEVVRLITQTVFVQQTQTAAALATPTPTFSLPTLTPTFASGGGAVFPTAPPLTGTDCVHQVQKGDTLFRLSYRYGLTVEQIAIRNDITNINYIRKGDFLIIPGCGTTGILPPPTYEPVYNPFPTPGAPTCLYVVRTGDNLFRISLNYGVSMHVVAAVNGIYNKHIILVGQELIIPGVAGGVGGVCPPVS